MKAHHVFLLPLLLLAACAAPTLQQRQDSWRRYRDVTLATCMVGQGDKAMPTEVRHWCAEVTAP
jgi:hypothetical protein